MPLCVLQRKQLLPVSGVGEWLKVTLSLYLLQHLLCAASSVVLGFLEKKTLFHVDSVPGGLCPVQWLQHHSLVGMGVSPTVQRRCRENAEPRAENKQAAVGRRNSRVKGDSEWKPASHDRRTHLRDVMRCAKEASDASSSSGQMLHWADIPSKITCVSNQMCEYVLALRLFLPKKSAAEIWGTLCMLESSQQSLSTCRWQGSPHSFLVTVCQAPFPDYPFFAS